MKSKFLKQPAAGSQRPELKGLGDLVHAVAAPVARVIDRVAGTNVQGCKACQKRRERWNRQHPFDAG